MAEALEATGDRLVTLAQSGDRAAFGQLYLRHFDRIYAFLCLAFKDRHEAEDAAQEVFIRVFEALPRYEARGAPFEAWLFRIVRNYSLNRLRKLSWTDAEDPDEIARLSEADAEPVDFEPEVLRWISDKDILVFIQRLPLAQRQVILLRYMMDFSVAETAEILGRTPNAIRQLQGRAFAYFRTRLEATHKAPKDHRPADPVRRIPRQAVVVRARKFMLSG